MIWIAPSEKDTDTAALEKRLWDTADQLLGRETKGEVVLVSRLRGALQKLNPALPPEAINAAVDELTRDLLLPRLLSGQVELKTQAA